MLVPHTDFNLQGSQPTEVTPAETINSVDAQAVDDPPSARFTWTIENFLKSNVKKLYSESFVVGGYKWQVLIFPKGNNVDHLSMYVDVADSGNLPYGWSRYAQFSLSVVKQVQGKFTIRKGFEALLSSVLGPRGNKESSFKLVKAGVSSQTFVKIGFAVQKKIKEVDLVGFPEWRTKPQNVRMHFEVLAKLDGNKIWAERVVQIQSVIAEDSVAQSVLTGNITISKIPIIHHPLNPF